MDLLNKLYHDAKKHRNDNDTLTVFEHMAFQVPIEASSHMIFYFRWVHLFFCQVHFSLSLMVNIKLKIK